MKKSNLFLLIGSITLTAVLLIAVTNFIALKPSPVLTLTNKRYILPPEAHRSVYKTEAECKNAVPAELWLECEPANSYYPSSSMLADNWLGPVYSGDTDPNLSRTAQNLPVSTVSATNENIGKSSLSNLITETRSTSSTYKPTSPVSESLTSKTTKLNRFKPADHITKTQL
jgi:hypothetical protein